MIKTTSQPDPLPRSARPVARALGEAGYRGEIRVFGSRAHTAQEAADMVGVETRQILKSMVFRSTPGDHLILVILSGDRQVDLARVNLELDESVERADPDWVLARTGYAIGGIPPLGHKTPPTVLIDQGLLDESILWAAAGTPNTMFRTSGGDLETLTGGTVVEVAKR